MANKWDERKKAQEEEYFVKKERELLEKLRSKQAKEQEDQTKDLCAMRCPKCGKPLTERSFQKVLVDQCTGCGGIWLDAGEMEQIAKQEGGGWLGKFWQRSG